MQIRTPTRGHILQISGWQPVLQGAAALTSGPSAVGWAQVGSTSLARSHSSAKHYFIAAPENVRLPLKPALRSPPLILPGAPTNKTDAGTQGGYLTTANQPSAFCPTLASERSLFLSNFRIECVTSVWDHLEARESSWWW